MWLVEHQPPKTPRGAPMPSSSATKRRTIDPATATGADLSLLQRHYAEQQSQRTGEDPAEVADRWRRFHAMLRG